METLLFSHKLFLLRLGFLNNNYVFFYYKSFYNKYNYVHIKHMHVIPYSNLLIVPSSD